MKKITILALLLAALTTATTAQKSSNAFSINHDWMKIAGYSYQPGYPYGFSLAGGSFLSFGFGADNQYTISDLEYRETSWSIRCGWLGYTFDEKTLGWKAISIRPMLLLGADFGKVYSRTSATGAYTKDGKGYFTMTPTLAVNIFAVHFSVGYEMVPKFKELNGLTFGVGFSIPYTESKSTSNKKTIYRRTTHNK